MNAEPDKAFRQNQALLRLFQKAPFLVQRYPARYLNALQNLLIDHFQLHHWPELEDGLTQLRQLPQKKAFKRLQGIEQRILERSTLLEANMLLVQKAYHKGRLRAAQLVPELQQKALPLSYSNQQSLLYIFALCQLLDGQADDAQTTLNLFLDRYRKKTLEELYHFGRLLQLLVHYNLKHFDLLPYLLQAFRRQQSPFYPESTALLLQYLQQLLGAENRRAQQKILTEWSDAIGGAQLTATESRFYEYLNLPHWLTGQLHGEER
ncbi:MAG: hypothetical protein RIC19_19510 [Phaeodactylibacter sp.]|uniref:hypothetical protein n=1 Tax=Phaeodactylibacter sp. TaxID=1940289 RepID=UPI0032EBC9D5